MPFQRKTLGTSKEYTYFQYLLYNISEFVYNNLFVRFIIQIFFSPFFLFFFGL